MSVFPFGTLSKPPPTLHAPLSSKDSPRTLPLYMSGSICVCVCVCLHRSVCKSITRCHWCAAKSFHESYVLRFGFLFPSLRFLLFWTFFHILFFFFAPIFGYRNVGRFWLVAMGQGAGERSGAPEWAAQVCDGHTGRMLIAVVDTWTNAWILDGRPRNPLNPQKF